jgi:hypothetical protein
MKHEYHEGHGALERFGKTMTALFRVPKDAKKETKKPVRKAKKSSKG